MTEKRKQSDIWKSIEDKQKISGLSPRKWKTSYIGIKAAIEYIGLQMITTQDEFDKLEVPRDQNADNCARNMTRKIVVSRDGIISQPTQICCILTGESSLMTDQERFIHNTKISIQSSIIHPKGQTTNNKCESKAINDLDILIGSDKYLYREHLWESRLGDIAYRLLDENGSIADQVKSSHAISDGRCQFKQSQGPLHVQDMIKIVENNMSLTCIGMKHENDEIEAVWYFTKNSVDELKKFDKKQIFAPIVHRKTVSRHQFILTMNSSNYRFDVGSSQVERNRLLQCRLDFVKTCPSKHSVQYFNEDDSQIPSETTRVEMRSFKMTREACNKVGSNIDRYLEDSYGPIDFRLDGFVKIQDKAAKNGFIIRQKGRYPYNPNDFDILQVSDLIDQIVYAIPMREYYNNEVKSHFTEDELMKQHVGFHPKWKAINERFKHDIKTEEGARLYVQACKTAAKIPPLTNEDFYKNMLDINAKIFGSKKQIVARREEELKRITVNVKEIIVGGKQINVRQDKYPPIHPNKIDVFKIVDKKTQNIVYGFQMRIPLENNNIASFFNEHNLMKYTIQYNETWKKENAKYRYDLNNPDDVLRFDEFCKSSSQVPPLTDTNFYKNMLENNAHLIDPKYLKESEAK